MLAIGKFILVTKLANRAIKKDAHLLAGDIIKVRRLGYWHVGVYIGHEEVIHFSSLDSDTSPENNKIIKTSLEQFLRGKKTLEKVRFPSPGVPPVSAKDDPLEFFFKDFLFYNPNYKLYPAHEVIERAKSRLGEGHYNLEDNNCEHFAIWCKTGISHSKQIQKLKKLLSYYQLDLAEKIIRFLY